MKKKINLNQLSKNDLNKREMSNIQGGLACGCGCHGSSSMYSNQNANAAGGLHSEDSIICWEWCGDSWDLRGSVS